MNEKCLSVFVDESGDFGPFEAHSPYYLVSLVLHDQSVAMEILIPSKHTLPMLAIHTMQFIQGH